MKKFIITIIALIICSTVSIAQNDTKQYTKWRGQFTFSVTQEDNFAAAFMRYKFNWGFSGEIEMEKSEEYSNSWFGESLNFSGTANDRLSYDSLKYTETITVRTMTENNNSAYLTINPDNNTYNLSINVGDFEKRYFIEIPPEIEALKTDTLGWFIYALIEGQKLEKEALIDNFSFVIQLNELSYDPNNPVITYNGEAETNYSLFNGTPLKGKLVLSISPVANEPDITVKTNKLTNPHCLCNDSIVEFTAYTNTGGGTFDKFEITYLSDKRPETVKNEGGAKPVLVLKGSGETAGKVKVKAVYKKDGNVFRSKAYEMNFCKIKKPEAGHTVSNSHGYDKEKFVFSEDIPGTLTVRMYSSIFYNGEKQEDPDAAYWRMEPEEDYLEKENSQYGISVTYKAKRLPAANNSFGKKKIKLTYFGESCECESEEAEFAIYYPRDAKNNPDYNVPNWAYYWDKTKAKSGYEYVIVEKIPDDKTVIALPGFACLGQVLDSYNAGVLARYDPFRGLIYIPQNLPDLTCPSRPDGKAYSGIDCFAQVTRHEGRHKDQLTSWWGPNMANYNCIDDIDGDFLPNAVEMATAGCNSALPWSCPGRPTWLGTVFDVDIDAYDYGWKWNPGDADKEDWASPGKQF